ncbi:alpha/beta fold hydrolase [Pimelobacter simplex]|uniref:Alpha/beta fold hydrolase n=1 Tax=Nocardioides simplex TaxID=2045 RepID=A0A7J5DY37_NOCSI|nr:alpha/beta fold hydrolase [Pimelobacter simplex]KAB2810919.1 alpha/beta fold hydrolase [Pimelobacter simplex]
MTLTALPSKTVSAAGHRTHYLEAGAGAGRPLVLLHGSGPGVSASANWSGVMPRLAETHHVFAPDLAGFGDTVVEDGVQYDIKLWVRQLVEFLDAVGLESATLVGNSFGGGLSLATALRHADRIDALVLLGTPAGTFEMTEGLRSGWYYEPDRAEMERILRLFPYDKDLVTPEMVEARYLASAGEGRQEAYRRLLPEPGPRDTPVRGVPEAALATIDLPALVLHGREDPVIPVEVGWRLATSMPNAEMHVFGNCGHWVQLERSQRFVELVTSFVRTLP